MTRPAAPATRQRPFKVPVPSKMAQLPVDARGYPIPKFVQWFNGEPDFRVVDQRYFGKAIRQHRCWICGERLGVNLCFVVGPISAINRVAAEPPSHHDCASFAVQACPFMLFPKAKRREGGLPDSDQLVTQTAALLHNPGLAIIWTTKAYRIRSDPFGPGYILAMAPPTRLEFWAKGRPATRQQVLDGVRFGLEQLAEAAGEDDLAEVEEGLQAFEELVRSKAIWPEEAATP